MENQEHSKLKLNIVFENENIIVINKPPGLVVCPGIKQETGILTEELIDKYPELKNVGSKEMRYGIVHRLDKETSGLMIIAKNQKTFEYLQKQFKQRRVKKTYTTLVSGEIKKDKGEIEGYMMRSDSDPRKWILKNKTRPIENKKMKCDSKTGRYSLTKFKVLKRYKNFTLLEVYPETGRMHQIRVHFASIGHPIVGDKVYGFRKKKRHPNLEISRHFLHASKIIFCLYDKKFTFDSELPSDLQSILDKLQITDSRF